LSNPFWFQICNVFFFGFCSVRFVGEHPPALLILDESAQEHFSTREAAPSLLFAGVGTDAMGIECACPGKGLFAAGAL
jgi:hypothetical protein